MPPQPLKLGIAPGLPRQRISAADAKGSVGPSKQAGPLFRLVWWGDEAQAANVRRRGSPTQPSVTTLIGDIVMQKGPRDLGAPLVLRAVLPPPEPLWTLSMWVRVRPLGQELRRGRKAQKTPSSAERIDGGRSLSAGKAWARS